MFEWNRPSPSNRWAACPQGPQCQSVLPLGREIVQRWTAVPRAGHILQEVKSHTVFMAPSGSSDSLTWPSCSRQADSWLYKVFHKVSHHPSQFYSYKTSYQAKLCFVWRNCTSHFSLPVLMKLKVSVTDVFSVYLTIFFTSMVLNSLTLLWTVFPLIDTTIEIQRCGRRD